MDASRDAVELLSAARAEFDGIVHALKQRMGESAPAMLGLRETFDDCQLLAQQILQLNATMDLPEAAPDSATESSDPTEAMAATGPGSAATARQPITRAQIYAQLAEAANALRRLEPHSPIPYLLERAVTLGSLPFPALMRELIRDAKVRTEMSREMGFKEGPSDRERARLASRHPVAAPYGRPLACRALPGVSRAAAFGGPSSTALR